MAKVTNFSKLLAPDLHQTFKKAIYASTPPFRGYSGAIIIDDDVLDAVINMTDTYCKTFRVLPPGHPLDLDLVEVVLQQLKLIQDFAEQVVNETATLQAVDDVVTVFRNNLEKIYMEVLWRQIKKKKK